jgi:hypothetical protein
MKANAGQQGKLFVLALVVVVVAVASLTALVVPVVGGTVAVGRTRVDSGAPVAAMYPGHTPALAPERSAGASVRWPGYECQGGYSCGGIVIAGITPTPVPPGPDAMCQSGAACGG